MLYRVMADLVVSVHAAFVVFVICGGLAVFRWPRLAYLHIPAAAWGVTIEMIGWVCPLTHLENRWRRMGGESGYEGTFIQQYLEPLLYPAGLTPEIRMAFGVTALLVNIAVYLLLWRRRRGAR